jgi:DNA-binding CsgD family transcriptional regulator
LATGENPEIDPELAVTALLEREQELAEFETLLAEVEAGRGCAVAIEAGAGLGKTRLLREARKAGADAGMSVLFARATELEQDFPFALVRQLFESHLRAMSAEERESVLEGAEAASGALGLGASDRDQDSFAVLHSLYWVTAALAERGPLLLAIDDGHSADPASLDYLSFLLPRLEELPVLLVLACRPGEPDPSGGLARVLADDSMRHLTLAPLSAEATGELLAREFGQRPEPNFATACHEVSGGNPFLLCELARTVGEEGIEPTEGEAEQVKTLAPERVARTLLMRVERLAAEAGDLARALAALGDESEPRLVAKLAETDPETAAQVADDLRAAGIFDAGSSLGFVHPLVRNAIYGDMPTAERTRAHGRAAALLRDIGASPERIATQLMAGEPRGDRATVETLLVAAERALANGAPRSTVAYLTRALREPPPPELRAVVLEPLITATFRAADQAAFTAIEADVFAEMERDPSLRSRWALPLTMALAMAGRFEEVASMLPAAIEVAAAEGDVTRAFQLEAQLKTVALLGTSIPDVDLERYAGEIEPDSPAGRLAATMEAREAIANGTAEEAAAAAEQALGNDATIFTEESEIAGPAVAVMVLAISGDVNEARRAVVKALALARESGDTPALGRALYLSAFVAWAEGDLLAAEADMRQAMDLVRLAAIVPLVLLFTPAMMEILIERDDLEAAEAVLLGTGMTSGPVPMNVIFNMLLMMRGHLRLEQGEFEQAAEDFSLFSERMEEMDMASGIAMATPHAARALVAIGEPEKARDLLERTLPLVRHWGEVTTIAHVLRGLAISEGGNEGIETLEEAAAMMEGSPRRLEHAYVLTDLGEALRREGRRADARAPLREAFELARRCGATRVAKRAHAELEATGEKVRGYAPIGVESLTPSERRVADLAASGMTNRQIAQSLFVTVKTVESHLSAAYDKLDIGSRRELPGALGQAEGSQV